MKAILLIFLASLLATGAASAAIAESDGPDLEWYYNSPCQQPADTSLHEWLDALEPLYPMEAGAWDCSQASAYVEWLVENCGHDAVIACNAHCWVIVEGHHYETVHMYWIPAPHEANVWFQDIHGAWDWTEANGASEWGWWITYPELVP